jgi:hypothetical protein
MRYNIIIIIPIIIYVDVFTKLIIVLKQNPHYLFTNRIHVLFYQNFIRTCKYISSAVDSALTLACLIFMLSIPVVYTQLMEVWVRQTQLN